MARGPAITPANRFVTSKTSRASRLLIRKTLKESCIPSAFFIHNYARCVATFLTREFKVSVPFGAKKESNNL